MSHYWIVFLFAWCKLVELRLIYDNTNTIEPLQSDPAESPNTYLPAELTNEIADYPQNLQDTFKYTVPLNKHDRDLDAMFNENALMYETKRSLENYLNTRRLLSKKKFSCKRARCAAFSPWGGKRSGMNQVEQDDTGLLSYLVPENILRAYLFRNAFKQYEPETELNRNEYPNTALALPAAQGNSQHQEWKKSGRRSMKFSTWGGKRSQGPATDTNTAENAAIGN